MLLERKKKKKEHRGWLELEGEWVSGVGCLRTPGWLDLWGLSLIFPTWVRRFHFCLDHELLGSSVGTDTAVGTDENLLPAAATV